MPSITTPLWLLSSTTALSVTSMLFCIPASAATFSDVPKNHFAYDAIGYLSDQKILAGYSDDTFKPDRKVNRAEALKIIASNFIPKSNSIQLKSTAFTDVPDNAWYLPSIEWAVTKKVIDGPPKTTAFHPTRSITKAEFLKMLFTAYGVDIKSFSDISLPLSSDVLDTGAWYYPYLRYAVATDTTAVSDAGLFGPNRELSRGDVALLLYRFTLYRNNQRTQELLTQTKQEVEDVITNLSKGKVSNAEFASARAILIARAALLTEPDAPVVKVAVKMAEGYRALTRAYRAGVNGDTAGVIKLSADASTLAGQARKISPEAKTLADQLDQYSKSFAAQAKGK